LVASNMPTEEVFTSPDPRATNGTFRCTFPLSFRGRLIHGLRGEFSRGRLVRLEADSDDDRDFVAAYIDTDRMGRRLGEVALVDASSRIGQAGRIYYNTLLDENAAAHIAFGLGFASPSSFAYAFRQATGVTPRRLGITSLDRLSGAGVWSADSVADPAMLTGADRVLQMRDGQLN